MRQRDNITNIIGVTFKEWISNNIKDIVFYDPYMDLKFQCVKRAPHEERRKRRKSLRFIVGDKKGRRLMVCIRGIKER